MADGKIFVRPSSSDATIFTGNINDKSQGLLQILQGEVEIGEKAITLYCECGKESKSISANVDSKWSDPSENAPFKLLLSFPYESKGEPNRYAQVFKKFAADHLSAAPKFHIKGELGIEILDTFTDYLAGDDAPIARLKKRIFDLELIEASLFTLPAIDKTKAGGSGNARGGSSAQSQADKISDRLTFCVSLESGDNRAKLMQAYLAVTSVKDELELKNDTPTFTEFVSIILQ